MGVALGWMALALSVMGAPDAGRGGVPIKYTVRFVEVEGLGWRDPVFARLTPVARQGAATVWTAPADVASRMVADALKCPAAHVLQAPAVTAWSGVPAHISTRADRRLVTQVAWTGNDGSIEAKPESVHTGSTATIAGRKLDQGVLVQMALQDTQIVAVHRVAIGDGKVAVAARGWGAECCSATAAAFGPAPAPADPAAKKAAHHVEAPAAAPAGCQAADEAKTANRPKLSIEVRLGGYRGITLPEPPPYIKDDIQFIYIPDASDAKTPEAAAPPKERVRGAEHTSKATDGVVAASASISGCCSAAIEGKTASRGGPARSVAVEVPEIGSQEIAGEWLIPNDGILLVSFGPHTVADKDGKAVIRERLAIVEAVETAAMPAPAPAAGSPMSGYTGVPAPMMARPIVVGAPPASMFAPTPSPVAFPGAVPPPPMAIPPIPSRSIPQGYHRDGKAADLPPLPADEADDDDHDDSAEPRGTPQMKKPRPPAEPSEATPQPSADAATKKAQFTVANFPAIPTLFQPAPAVGLQFLLPIKPVSLKLPFNRRLEIEIYGRVVHAPEPAHNAPELATKGGATTK